MQLINLAAYQEAAQSKIPASYYAYYAGGSADEITLKQNQTVFADLQLRPRMLRNVAQRSLTTTVLGQPMTMPVIMAPIAMAKLAHADGEVAIAQAAKQAGVIQCLSTLSTTSLESVATIGANNWFQLYVYKDRHLTQDLVDRATEAGYSAIILTVDTPIPGIRDNAVGLQLPPGLPLANLQKYHDTDATALLPYVASQLDPALEWKDVQWLVNYTALPVLVKGILRGDDAQKAIDCGVAGIIVSNHGGRQLDTAVTGLDALPEVVTAVNGHIDVLVDGGVRRGTDILKAIALGAKAVLVGRPILWGLAINGTQGVTDVLAILRREFDTAMALGGCASVSEIGADLIVNPFPQRSTLSSPETDQLS
ncbi:MAG: alpha-hydroxy acid oxidase [Leptolyngbyaceae cyanobacterium]